MNNSRELKRKWTVSLIVANCKLCFCCSCCDFDLCENRKCLRRNNAQHKAKFSGLCGNRKISTNKSINIHMYKTSLNFEKYNIFLSKVMASSSKRFFSGLNSWHICIKVGSITPQLLAVCVPLFVFIFSLLIRSTRLWSSSNYSQKSHWAHKDPLKGRNAIK